MDFIYHVYFYISLYNKKTELIKWTVFIAIGILIGLPLFLTIISEEEFNFITVIIYMTIINAFIVSSGILPLWTQIMFLLIVVSLAIIEIKSNRSAVI